MRERPPIADNTETTADEERLIEAALWLERLSLGADENTRTSFEDWLAASPLNSAAFENVSQTRDCAKQAADQPEILSLRQQTLARTSLRRPLVRRRGISFLRGRARGEQDGSRKGSGRAAFAAGIAVCLVGGAGIWLTSGGRFPMRDIAALTADTPRPETAYRTGVGEQTTIELADGSQIVLNTDSAVRVAYSNGGRRLVLDRGEAFFTVAKDPNRPFTVEADGRVITAFGTAFDVRIQQGAVRVALLEGKVSVSPGGSTRREAVTLLPNDMAIVGKNTLEVVRLTNAASLTAWRDGLLIFQNDELRSVVEEVNRYSTTHIVLDGEAIGRQRVSGTFRIGQTTAFLEALHEMFPVHVADRRPGEIVLTRN